MKSFNDYKDEIYKKEPENARIEYEVPIGIIVAIQNMLDDLAQEIEKLKSELKDTRNACQEGLAHQ